MKLKTLDHLERYLDDELAWRKRETTTLWMAIQGSKTSQVDTNVRSGVVLLYSHWEGYIKSAAQAYLNYIRYQGVSYNSLKNNFRAIGVKEEFKVKSSSRKSLLYHLLIVDKIRDHKGKFEIDPQCVIDTGSNLKAEVLKEILYTIGIDYSPYELKENLIDSTLLANRNKIAHGERNYNYETLRDSFGTLKKEIMDMLDTFKSQLNTAASNKEYLE